MEIVKALALGAAVGFPLLALLTMLMSYLVRTQYQWRKLPPPTPNPPMSPWFDAPKVSK